MKRKEYIAPTIKEYALHPVRMVAASPSGSLKFGDDIDGGETQDEDFVVEGREATGTQSRNIWDEEW